MPEQFDTPYTVIVDDVALVIGEWYTLPNHTERQLLSIEIDAHTDDIANAEAWGDRQYGLLDGRPLVVDPAPPRFSLSCNWGPSRVAVGYRLDYQGPYDTGADLGAIAIVNHPLDSANTIRINTESKPMDNSLIIHRNAITPDRVRTLENMPPASGRTAAMREQIRNEDAKADTRRTLFDYDHSELIGAAEDGDVFKCTRSIDVYDDDTDEMVAIELIYAFVKVTGRWYGTGKTAPNAVNDEAFVNWAIDHGIELGSWVKAIDFEPTDGLPDLDIRDTATDTA